MDNNNKSIISLSIRKESKNRNRVEVWWLCGACIDSIWQTNKQKESNQAKLVNGQ